GGDRVWGPMGGPWLSISRRTSGWVAAISPTTKKVALVHSAAKAARMARVELGAGPSSKVKTTSPGARKLGSPSGVPNQGPPVVSTSIVLETPRALLQSD